MELIVYVLTPVLLLFMSLSIAIFSLGFTLSYMPFFIYPSSSSSLDQLKNAFIYYDLFHKKCTKVLNIATIVLYLKGGDTPRHYAAAYNALDVAALLIEEGDNVDEADNVYTVLTPFYVSFHCHILT